MRTFPQIIIAMHARRAEVTLHSAQHAFVIPCRDTTHAKHLANALKSAMLQHCELGTLVLIEEHK